MDYIQKNNFNYYKNFYLVKMAKKSLVIYVRKLLFKEVAVEFFYYPKKLNFINN